MLYLTLANIRSFSKRCEIPIMPLTIITGENSTGKSTLLACLSALFDPEGFPFQPSFNKPPYSLGSYDTIASFKGGKFGRAKSFSIGYRNDQANTFTPALVEATYTDQEGQPGISRVIIERGKQTVEFNLRKGSSGIWKGHVRYKNAEKETYHPFATRQLPSGARLHTVADFFLMFTLPAATRSRGKRNEFPSKEYTHLIDEVSSMALSLSPGRCISIAPIRTRPERVYGSATETYDPSGNHVPFILDRLLKNPQSRETKLVVDAINRFGDDSGLYSRVRVRRLGSKLGDPFQVVVNVGGRERNLIDVGYGVSQSLPIIIQTALSSNKDAVLIQQPEVHLHPRAQAALGNFFVRLVRIGKRRIVIETHSDYIIDRIRTEIAKGFPANYASLLYLERKKLDSIPHIMKFDSEGNIVDAPRSYRMFFLEEQKRVLKRANDDVRNN